MAEIRALIFDLGRTLVDLDLKAGLFGRLVESSSEPDQVILEQVLADPLFREFSSGRLPAEQFHKEVMKRTGLELDYGSFVDLWCAIFRPMSGMQELLADLKGSIPLGILSDTDPLHWRHLLRLNPWLASPHRALSFETGFLKPDPESYLAAARLVGKSPGNCLFIDDLERNVMGARAVGMPAIRFIDQPTLRSELEKLKIVR